MQVQKKTSQILFTTHTLANDKQKNNVQRKTRKYSGKKFIWLKIIFPIQWSQLNLKFSENKNFFYTHKFSIEYSIVC